MSKSGKEGSRCIWYSSVDRGEDAAWKIKVFTCRFSSWCVKLALSHATLDVHASRDSLMCPQNCVVRFRTGGWVEIRDSPKGDGTASDQDSAPAIEMIRVKDPSLEHARHTCRNRRDTQYFRKRRALPRFEKQRKGSRFSRTL